MSQYSHTQQVAAATWTITHNLNKPAVVCDVFVHEAGELQKILPLNIQHTNANVTTITFSSGRTGSARVAA